MCPHLFVSSLSEDFFFPSLLAAGLNLFTAVESKIKENGFPAEDSDCLDLNGETLID